MALLVCAYILKMVQERITEKTIPKNLLKNKICKNCKNWVDSFDGAIGDWCMVRATRPRFDTCKYWKISANIKLPF